MLLKALRQGIGQIIVFANYITKPSQISRSSSAQETAQQQANALTLYQFYACPFCVKTRRTIHRLNIDITTKDASNDSVAREELKAQGGEIKVPCLKIISDHKTTWMYESNDIICYLDQQFGVA